MYRENDDLNDLINTLNGLSPNLNGEENNMDDMIRISQPYLLEMMIY